jgi:hypothetical protein
MRVSRIHDRYLDRQNCLQRARLLTLVKMYRRMNEECDRVWKMALTFPLDSPERLEYMAIGDELSNWVSNLGNAEVVCTKP